MTATTTRRPNARGEPGGTWNRHGTSALEFPGAPILIAFLTNSDRLFKHAPVVGRSLARAAVGEGLAPSLHPEAKLGAELFETTRR